MYPVEHKIKTKKLADRKKNEKKYLNATGLEHTSFDC